MLAEIRKKYESILLSLLKNKKLHAKYYYIDPDFISNQFDIKFEIIKISNENMDKINIIGKREFIDIEMSLLGNSTRYSIYIKHFNKAFPSGFTGIQEHHREYMEEYFLLQSLELIEIEHKVIKQQKYNFLIKYLLYLSTNNLFNPLRGYKRISSYPDIYNKLIDKIDKNLNNDLIQKFNKLCIKEEYINRIDFLYNIEGSASHEELRFALNCLKQNVKTLYFRGQANSNWTLDSSITREKNC